MNLLKDFSSNVKKKQWWYSNEPIVVAVSTGIDSMSLLYMLEHLKNLKPKIIVAHVNHELRAASETEEQYLKTYCYQHDLCLEVTRWQPSMHPTSGIENAARNFRYAFFKKIMAKYHAQILLTAHHQNDQAETFLMKLIRGGDLTQLIGIRPIRHLSSGGVLIRPLLKYPKRLLIKFAKQHQIKWYEDQTNRSLKIMRNRMRHVIIPQMEKENSAFLNHVTNYTEQLQVLVKINHHLMEAKMRHTTMNFNSLLYTGEWNLKLIVIEPWYLQLEMMKAIFHHYFHQFVLPSHALIEMIKLINDVKKPQAKFKLSGLIIEKSYNILKITNVSTTSLNHSLKEHAFNVIKNHWYDVSNIKFGVFDLQHSEDKFGKRMSSFNLKSTDFPLHVRPWVKNDVLKLKNGGHQKIRRVLIDQKVRNADRKKALVLTTADNYVLALLGYKEAYKKLQNSNLSQYRFVLKFLN